MCRSTFTPRGGLQVVTDATTTPLRPRTDCQRQPGHDARHHYEQTRQLRPLVQSGPAVHRRFLHHHSGRPAPAVLSDANTKVLQSPQLRAVDNVKATLKIGDRQPTATGSFQPGIGGVGINPLVNTQFTFIDVGVNVEITPRVHDNGDVSLHIDLDISSVTGHVNLGGIDQPIIGQRKDLARHPHAGGRGATCWAASPNTRRPRPMTGVPGLASIPIIGRLFSGESVDRQRQELMIALIPHIVRRPEYTAENLRGIAVGNQQSVHLNYGRQAGSTPPAAQLPLPRTKTLPANPPVAAGQPGSQPPVGHAAVDPSAGRRSGPGAARNRSADDGAADRAGRRRAACGTQAGGQRRGPVPAAAGGHHRAGHDHSRPDH